MLERHVLDGFTVEEIKEIMDAFEHNLRLAGEDNKPHPIHEFKFVPRSVPFIFKDNNRFYRANRTFANGQVLVDECKPHDFPPHLWKRKIDIWQYDKYVTLPTEEELKTIDLYPSLEK